MSFYFDVLWLDDSPMWLESEIAVLETVLERNNIVLRVDPFSDMDRFLSKLQKSNEAYFNKYDLIMVDYNLSHKENGSYFISQIRSKNIISDILFYSTDSVAEIWDAIKEAASEQKEVVESEKNSLKATSHIANPTLSAFEGIYVADKSFVREEFQKLVQKQLKRSSSVVEVRGVLMDLTSEFDYVMREGIKKFFPMLTDDAKTTVLQQLDNAVAEAKVKSKDNFLDVEKAISKGKINKVVESIYYVMDIADKYAVLETILSKLPDISSLMSEGFKAEEYEKEIIAKRNKLAHKYINVSPCNKFLSVFNSIDNEITNSCNACAEKECPDKYGDASNRISSKDIEKLKECLFKYWQLFSQLHNIVRGKSNMSVT